MMQIHKLKVCQSLYIFACSCPENLKLFLDNINMIIAIFTCISEFVRIHSFSVVFQNR